ncbi:MAG: preprotein translocase subunit SecA [Bacteroidetes bacterium ADurb.Bin408]|nr:MAG: preprotein translocase subunit SecA [Bacteroidetes bacterium ADurb.Bin408]
MWPFGRGKCKLIKEDKVWMHSAARYLNLTKDLKGLSGSGQTVLLYCFFGDTHSYLSEVLEKTQISFNLCSSSGQIISGKTNLILASVLMKEKQLQAFSVPTAPLEVLLPEHHPLFSVEEDFFEALEAGGGEVVCRFYLSLDDPLFQLFGAGNIEQMMQRLGMTEEEHITHSMITQAIEKAQKKTEKNAKNMFGANSAKEWYKKNRS